MNSKSCTASKIDDGKVDNLVADTKNSDTASPSTNSVLRVEQKSFIEHVYKLVLFDREPPALQVITNNQLWD